MLDRFRHIVEDMRGLIEDSRSASPFISGNLKNSGHRYLLAVSGGVDSMCLADMWLRCFGAGSCAIAHCNFHLRGDESDSDEALVTEWAEKYDVLLHKADFDTSGYASENGVSIEMAARELRYGWFGDLCREYGYAAVVVAHHADDNAETLVLNMLRGAGIRGLAGMKPIAPLPSGLSFRTPSHHIGSSEHNCERSVAIHILRPLLTFTRKQIEGHVFAWKVPYHEDSTNSSVEYRRNSIRHEVFPLFEKINPSYVRTLNREMTYLSDASSIVEEWCRDRFREVSIPDAGLGDSQDGMTISIPALLAVPQWRYLLYYMMEPFGFNASVLESLESLLVSDRTVSGKRFDSPTHSILTGRDSIAVVRKTDAAKGGYEDDVMEVEGPGTYRFDGMQFCVEQMEWTADMPFKQPEGVLIFDSAALGFPFFCRRWRRGDWMVPFGMRGKKKISDIFADLKYGVRDKHQAVVLVARTDGGSEHRVAAVLGVRQDDSMKVTSSTEKVIRIEVIKSKKS